MTEKKITRKEKSIANKAKHATISNKKNLFATVKRIQDNFEFESEDKQERFIECIEAGFTMLEAQSRSKFYLKQHYVLMNEDDNYFKTFTRAREIADENLVENLMTEAFTEPKTIYDAQQNTIYDKTELQWRQNKESTVKYLLSVRNAKRYGTTRIDQQVSGPNGVPLNGATVVVTQAELDAATMDLENESK